MILKDFRNFLITEKNLAKKSVESYLLHVNKFLEFVNKAPDMLIKSDCVDYIAHLKEKEVSSSTLAIKIISIRIFLNYLGKNFMDKFRSPKIQRKDILILNREKVREIFSGIENQKYKLMISLMYFCGLRVSEVINIKVSDVNLKENKIKVKRKRNKEKIISINNSVKKLLANWIKKNKIVNNEYIIFGRNKNKPITRQGVNKKLREIGESFGIERLHAHTFRHSIATEMAKNNINIAIIQKFLDHDNIATTQKYLHLDKKDVNIALESLNFNF